MARTKKPVSETCHWSIEHDGEYWDTECGEAFILLDGTPVENKMRFCPYCGRYIKTGKRDS